MSNPITVHAVVSYVESNGHPHDRAATLAQATVTPTAFADAYAIALREMRAGEIPERSASALRALALRDALRIPLDRARARVEDVVEPVDYVVALIADDLSDRQRAMLAADPAEAEPTFA